jgi:hypothetical protein
MEQRGSGDTAINMPAAEAVQVLKNVVSEQRTILGDVFDGMNVTDIPQMWCLYKEVQGYYEDFGLTVPDDITLLWTDDNWGNVRRLPLANETGRSGGAGRLTRSFTETDLLIHLIRRILSYRLCRQPGRLQVD